MKDGMGSFPICSELLLNIILVVKGVDLKEVAFIFNVKYLAFLKWDVFQKAVVRIC